MKDRLKSLELLLSAHPDCIPGSEMDDRMWDVKRILEDLENGLKIDVLLPEERRKIVLALAWYNMDILKSQDMVSLAHPEHKGQYKEYTDSEIEFNTNLIKKLDQ